MDGDGADAGLVSRRMAVGIRPTAKPLHEEALRLWRALGSATGVAVALGNLGDVARDQGALAEAADRLRESLEISWALRLDWMVVEDLFFLADVARRAGRLVEAARLLGAAERLRETIGHALLGMSRRWLRPVRPRPDWRSVLSSSRSPGAGGHALSGEQAVATALEVADALAGEHGTTLERADFRRDPGSF